MASIIAAIVATFAMVVAIWQAYAAFNQAGSARDSATAAEKSADIAEADRRDRRNDAIRRALVAHSTAAQDWLRSAKVLVEDLQADPPRYDPAVAADVQMRMRALHLASQELIMWPREIPFLPEVAEATKAEQGFACAIADLVDGPFDSSHIDAVATALRESERLYGRLDRPTLQWIARVGAAGPDPGNDTVMRAPGEIALALRQAVSAADQGAFTMSEAQKLCLMEAAEVLDDFG